jgi:hypothetical protein
MLSLVQREFLNDLIVLRHAELARFVLTLSRYSERIERRGKRLKVATIILGAFSASQGVALEVFGKSNMAISIGFASVGIAVAAIAGVEAAFRFEARAPELRMLAAKCQAARFHHNSEWANRIAIANPEEAIVAAKELLSIQDRTLGEVQLEAAKLGVNIVITGDDDREARDDQAPSLPAAGAPDTDFPPPSASPKRPSAPRSSRLDPAELPPSDPPMSGRVRPPILRDGG